MYSVVDLFLLFSIFSFAIFGIAFCYSSHLKYPRLEDSLYMFFFSILTSGVWMYINDSSGLTSFYNGLIIRDSITNLLCAGLLSIILVTGFVSKYYNRKLGISTFEYLLFLLFFGFNATLLVSSSHLFLTFLLVEIHSTLLIIVAAINRRNHASNEAGLKYYILGSFSSITLLLGIALLYIFTSFLYYNDLRLFFSHLILFSSNAHIALHWGIYLALPLIAIGFLFKVYSAPFHFWVPDIYQGSANSAVLFFSTTSVFVYFFTFVKLYYVIFIDFASFFQDIMLALSVLTMIAGTVGGLMQRKLKRVLAYSSVNATGYLLLVLSTNNIFGLASFFYYLILYVIAIFSVFVISSQIVIDNRSFISFIDDFENFYKTNKALSFLLSSFFFSLAGIPPFLGFFGKFEILGSLFFSGYLSAFLAILIVSIISFLYYARIIKAVYTKKLGNVHYLENFSFFNVVVIVFCFTLLLLGIVSSGSVHFFSQLLVFHLVSV